MKTQNVYDHSGIQRNSFYIFMLFSINTIQDRNEIATRQTADSGCSQIFIFFISLFIFLFKLNLQGSYNYLVITIH